MPSPVQVVATVVGSWLAWYLLVVRPATTSLKPWGPKWLATFASGLLYRFGKCYLTYSNDLPQAFEQKGILGKDKQYVLVWHPHGAFTVSALYFVSHMWASDFPDPAVRGFRYVCVAPLLLRIPILAEFLLLCHARNQDRKTFGSLLKQGATVAVQPGGLIEQVNTDHKQEQIYFPKNLGFIKLALEHGVPLLPLYAFGENQLYHTAEWVRNINRFFYNRFKAGNFIVLGQFGIPNSPVLPNPLMLPIFRGGLHIRHGDPVEVGSPDPNPSDEKVQEVFKRYMAEVQKVFDTHKDECLPPEVAQRGLIIRYRGDGDDGSPPRRAQAQQSNL